MARFILKWRYLKSGGKHGFNTVRYIATREGVEKCDESWRGKSVTKAQEKIIKEILTDFPDSKESFEYQEYQQSKNRYTASQFIEKAIDFYCGYLTAENYKEYFPNVIVSTMKARLDAMENHLARNFFKMAVEQAMMMHVLAYTQGIDEDTLGKLRGYCVAECKSINGVVSFADAVKFQNRED